MTDRVKNAFPKVVLALVPFMLLLGVWIWKQPGEASSTESAARPSPTATSAASVSTPVPTERPPFDTRIVKTSAELVLKIYLSNPSPRVKEGLSELQPLVSRPLFTRVSGEWEGATTRAAPRVGDLRSVTVEQLENNMGVTYKAEAVQIVTFPSGQDENNTLSVFMRLKQEENRWIVYDLKVT